MSYASSYEDDYTYSSSGTLTSSGSAYLKPPSSDAPRTRSSSVASADPAPKGKDTPSPPPGPYVNVLATHELRDANFFRALYAELLATCFFTSFSIGGIASAHKSFEGGVPGQEHTFVLVFHVLLILIVIYAVAAISGAHFNPAVSLGTLLAQRITAVRCVGYVVMQLLGSMLGAVIMIGAIPGELEGSFVGIVLPAAGVKEEEAFLMEFFCTFGLVFGAFAIAFDPRGWGALGPVAIAVIVGINVHVGSFVSGAAMNPARAFGPAAVHGNFDSHWVYWAGGLLGGASAAITYEYTFMNRKHARTSVPSATGDARSHSKHE